MAISTPGNVAIAPSWNKLVDSISPEFGSSKTKTYVNQLHSNRTDALTLEEMSPIIDTLNKFFEVLDADLRLQVHQDTKRLMTQFISTKDQRVLKEFPPEAFLDMVARIRAYIGSILDEKA